MPMTDPRETYAAPIAIVIICLLMLAAMAAVVVL